MESDIIRSIREELFSLSDPEYRAFQAPLIPNVPEDLFIGVRTPVLRRYARELSKTRRASVFLDSLPHDYFDENQLHAFLLERVKPFESCLHKVNCFLPNINNWATCDQLNPAVFKSNREQLLPWIRIWLTSPHTYTVRFAIGMLMRYFLDDLFDREYPKLVAGIRSEEYYINMMIAWYFATALAKQYDAVIPYRQERRLSKWIHNKTIQKAVESYRITDEQKQYLRTLRIRKKG